MGARLDSFWVGFFRARPMAYAKSRQHESVWYNKEPLFEVSVSRGGLEPIGSAKWTEAGKIRNRRQITTLHIWSVLEPTRIVSDPLPNLRPATSEMSCL